MCLCQSFLHYSSGHILLTHLFLNGDNGNNSPIIIMIIIIIGAELGDAAGARAPPLLHNPESLYYKMG